MEAVFLDIIAEKLAVVFCGINPATSAAVAGHHFSRGSNRFWCAIHLAGFTPEEILPRERSHDPAVRIWPDRGD